MRGVIFDLDGVLCATEPLHGRAWAAATADFGLPFSDDLNERLRGLTRSQSLHVILGDRSLPPEDFAALLNKKGAYYQAFVDRMTPHDLAPGVRRLLDELSGLRIPLAVASSSQLVKPVLRQLGILRHFQFVVDGTQVQHSKPAPDAYLQAAKGLGLLPPTCLAIEDSPAGIQAARAANMPVVGLGPAERVGQAGAVFPSLSRVTVADLRAVHASSIHSGLS